MQLKQIDIERWKFILYKSENDDFYCDFSYSPVSYCDMLLLIKLTEEEKNETKLNRDYLVKLSEKVSYYFRDYLPRALNRKDFEFVD
ncbi:hypothetical protein GCM10011508_12520 [Flavobacterium lutivivi]|nr:hypothetical protein GCM10011508_12520 [Flavobacterium lutivivi]